MKFVWLVSLALVASPAGAKDRSRVPSEGHPSVASYSLEVCQISVEAKRHKRKLTLHKRMTLCRRYPAWVQPVIRVSWSNVFLELQRARECGVTAFSNQPCRG